MGIFKKTIKYSKPSKDLENKIKKLDEELKNTGVIEEESDSVISYVQEFVVEKLPKICDEVNVQVEEERLYHWRDSFTDSIIEFEDVEDEKQYHKSLNNVESYISQSNKELIEVRDQIFQEISESTLLNLPEIKDKISKVLEIYDQIQEGLLNEPSETKNSDPLTPLVSVEDLNKHYTLFINRIQQQLSTLGGGGETKLKYLDDIVGIATNASAYNGKFLKYEHSIEKFVFAEVSGGSGSGDYASVAGIATYATLAGVSTYATTSGVSTYASTAGIATYATTSGVSTYATTSGVSTYASTAGVSTTAGTATTSTYLANAANIITGTIAAERLSSSNAFNVYGDLYVQGNVSIGGTTVSLVAQELKIRDTDLVVGFTTDVLGNDISNETTANHGGVAVASTIGTPLVEFSSGIETTPHTYKKIMWFKNNSWTGLGTDAWLFNYAVGIGSTQVPNGVRLSAGSVQFTQNDLSVVRDINASGIITASSFSGNATSATTAGYASTAGISTFATTAGIATNATTAGFATTAGISTVSQGLTGTPNIVVGVITATDYRIQSVSEKTTLVNGNTVSLVYNTGGGNIAICTNPSGDVTLNVTGIPTDSNFDNRSLTFSVIVNNTGTARSCTSVSLNGFSRTIKWFGGSLATAISGVTTSSGYDIYNFTGINTVGSATTTANYEILGTVNGGYR